MSETLKVDIDLKLPLRQYQIKGVNKFVDFPAAFFADEMGVGKTVQCIALDLVRRKQAGPGDWKTLVVCPLTGVVDQWVDEFKRFTDLRVRRINPKKRDWLFNEDADVYVVHYDALRIMGVDGLVKALPKGQWLHIILDEIHKIKNRKAKTSKEAVEVGKHFEYRSGASGTPMENRPDELFHIFKFFFPTMKSRKGVNMKLWFRKVLNSYWRFYERYVEYYEDDEGYHHIIGPRNVAELKELREPFWIRRLKDDPEVDLQLPPKQYQPYEVDLLPKQRKAYDGMKRNLIAWIGANENQPVNAPIVAVQLIRLQQFALAYGEIVPVKIRRRKTNKIEIVDKVKLTEPSSKLDCLCDILEDLGDTQCIVYSTSKQVMNMAQVRLEDRLSVTTGLITGDVTDIRRSAAIKRFQQGDTQVLCATIRSGGQGLNLQNANTVIFLDRDWVPGKNQQGEDRVHRSGQQHKSVHIIDIMARNTVDQRKDREIKRKWSWIKEVVGA